MNASRLRWWTLTWIAAIALALSAGACRSPAPADPALGSASWVVIKCKLGGEDVEPRSDDEYERLFHGPEGIQAYFEEVSYERYRPEFELIPGWVTLSRSAEEDRELSRWDRISECMKAHSIRRDDWDGVVVIRNVRIDSGYSGEVLLNPASTNVTFAAHEIGHHLGLGHSWDFSDRKNSSWSSPGEYFDHWDIMSAMAVYKFRNDDGYVAGPQMALASKLRLGWVEASEVVDLEVADLAAAESLPLRISPLDRPQAEAPVGVRIRLASGDVYTVEYRVQREWDRGIPRSAVLIHQVKGRRPYNVGPEGQAGDWAEGDVFEGEEGVRIAVENIDSEGAELTLSWSETASDFPTRAKPAADTGSRPESAPEVIECRPGAYIPNSALSAR